MSNFDSLSRPAPSPPRSFGIQTPAKQYIPGGRLGSSPASTIRASIASTLGVPLQIQNAPTSLPGLPFSKEALPHAYSKLAISNKSREEESDNSLALDFSGVGIRHIAPLFRVPYANTISALYLTANFISEIPSEISLLTGLSILHISLNNLKSIPDTIGNLLNLRELLLNDNMLSTLPFSMANLYQLRTLSLDGNPWTDPFFSSLRDPMKAAMVIPAFLRDNAPPPSPPPPRTWEILGASTSTSFTILSFNILAEIYADQMRYPYTPSWALQWQYRRDLIIQILRSSDADFICLQEVEFGQFQPLLSGLRYAPDNPDLPEEQWPSYQAVFLPKHRFRTCDQKQVVDGCAIFWKPTRFSLEEVFPIEFASTTDSSAPTVQFLCQSVPYSVCNTVIDPTPDLYNRALLKDNVALIGRFRRVDTQSPPIFVASVHLQWDPAFKDVQLLQAVILSERIKFIRKTWATSPIFLAGDFNADFDSAVASLLGSGSIDPSHQDWLSFSYPPYTTLGFSTTVRFQSAYSESKSTFTNFTDQFVGSIDYIWFSSPIHSLSGRLALPSRDVFEGIVGLPSVHYPSDHLPLMAEFSTRSPSRPISPFSSPPMTKRHE